MIAASGNNHSKNPYTKKIMQRRDKRKGNVALCLVQGHAGRPETKRRNDEKYLPEDLIGWIKTEMAAILKQGKKMRSMQ
jgi:hypothetical protein